MIARKSKRNLMIAGTAMILVLIAAVRVLAEAAKFYGRESTYNVTCAMEQGIPTEVPHLIVEEDSGRLAREALASAFAELEKIDAK